MKPIYSRISKRALIYAATLKPMAKLGIHNLVHICGVFILLLDSYLATHGTRL